jgi:hypothetical protein
VPAATFGINIFNSTIEATHTVIKIMKWISIFTTVFALLILAARSVVRGQDFKTDVWLEDFTQLKREMSAKYANLEWAIENRGLDLKQLSEQTESRLPQARNEAEAKKIIESFLDAFGDRHLSVQWAQNKDNNSSSAGRNSRWGWAGCAGVGGNFKTTLYIQTKINIYMRISS